MKKCEHPNCGGDGYWRDGPWGNYVPCDCHPSESVDHSIQDPELSPIDEDRSLAFSGDDYEPDQREPLLLEEDFSVKNDVSCSSLSSDMLDSLTCALKKPTFDEIIDDKIRQAKKWLIEKERKIVDGIPMAIKIRTRRAFYRYQIEVKPENFNSGVLRVIFHLEPNWMGRKLGYQKDRKGYYGTAGSWARLFGQVHEGEIPNFFQKKLDQAYYKHYAPRAIDRVLRGRI